jgi:beta-lactamase superfamily II metal-dependent hydrolase
MKNSAIRIISSRAELQTYHSYLKKPIFPVSLLILILCVPYAFGTPPNYKSFHRDQRTDYQPNPDDLMRIWTVYVGQGDGLLIQLPPKCNYDPDPTDDVSSRTETVDVLIDGGSHSPQNETIMESFVLNLYDEPAIIEHAVITHHDGDHVKGLIHILTGDSVGVESIYHNGLASYRRGKRGFSNSTTAAEAVRDISGGQLVRGMAFLEPDDDDQGKKLSEDYLINTKQELQQGLNNDEFQGVYDELANAVVDEDDPIEVRMFQRCVEDGPFIEEREAQLNRGVDLAGIEFKLIWPLERARKYGGWGETINGNSVTFRLDYGDFSMLFSGDHNEKSEEKLVEHLDDANELDLLNVDVLKVPHHGSWHAYEPFFRRRTDNSQYIRPVLSVASMGPRGFTTSWRHPSNEVIKWLGGAHRVYHTFIHEKRFNWSDLQTQEEREQMHERKHILIETDGEWFRIVEVDVREVDLTTPPTVQQTHRSHGTRWIRAK